MFLLPVVLGFVLGWVAQQIRQELAERINHLNNHVSDIERFAQYSLEYWLTKPDDQESDLLLAAKVRAAFFPISYFYSDSGSIHDPNVYLDLMQVATGGSFETQGRDADVNRALQVQEIAWSIVHDCRKRRTDLSSISSVFGEIWALLKGCFFKLKDFVQKRGGTNT